MRLSLFNGLGRIITEHPGRSLAFFLLVFCVVYALKLDHGGMGGGDDIHYMRGAYYLAKHDTYSMSPDPSHMTLHARRAPGYPLFLAGCIKLIPALNNMDYKWLFPQDTKQITEPQQLVYFKYVQAILLLLTALMIAYLIRDISGRYLPAYFALWAVAFHPFLSSYVNRFYTEMFGAFLITAFSTMLYVGLKRRGLLYFMLSGLFLGVLTLTLAQWKYIGCVAIGSALLYTFLDRKKIGITLVGITVMTLLWVAVFFPWELRNQQHFGKRFIGAGGGIVLEIRSQYDMVPKTAYWASFLYWSRAPLLKKALYKYLPKEQYAVLDRDNPSGVYQQAQTKKMALIKEVGLVKANSMLQQQAITRILENPVKHLLMCFPVGLRLMMNATFSLFYIGVYYLFVLALVRSLLRKEWLIAAILASPMALFCFNTLLTHGLPRYNEQATPVLVLGAILGWVGKKERATTLN